MSSAPRPHSSRSHLKRHTALSGLVLLGALSLSAMTAQAQTAPQTATPATTETAPAPAKPATTAPATAAPADPGTVTVVGEKPVNRIDRQTYDNTKNIDSQTGTAADALNKVPSVSVDPAGNVTLRGQSNVQVMIDGKPSAMMSGDNRAAALQAMSSGDIQSVEVINNPGAQFGSEGTGGIINLVMNRNRKPGKSGSVNLNLGSEGRYRTGLTGSYNSPKVTISGGINAMRDLRPSSVVAVYDQKNPTTGAVTSHSVQTGKSETEIDNLSANGGIDYNLGDKDTIGIQGNIAKRQFDTTSSDTYSSTVNPYSRTMTSERHSTDGGLEVRWDHKGDIAGETLKTSLRYSKSDATSDTLGVNTYTASVVNNTRTNDQDVTNIVFSVDYNRPIGDDILTTGIQIQRDESEVINGATRNGAPDTGLINRFDFEQTLSAAYITYQKPLGDKWTILGGLRAEQLELDTHLVYPTPTNGHIKYTKVNPSFFATRILTDKSKLRLSYSHRLQRPSPQDLNPNITYFDEKNVAIGNPNLKPQETDAFEARYEFTAPGLNYALTGYYRKNDKVINSVSTFDTNGVLVTTKQNEGSGANSGLQFEIQGKLSPKLSVSANGNVYYSELETPNVDGTQSLTSVGGRVAIDYTITPKDRMQFSVFSSGKQLTGQGYRAPFSMANISYSHTVNPKLTFIATVNDPFQMGKQESITDSKTVYSKSTRKIEGQIFYVGLRYNFGGPAPANQQQNQGPRMMGPGGPGGPGGGGGGPM